MFLFLKEKARKEIFVGYLLYVRHFLDAFHMSCHWNLTSSLQKKCHRDHISKMRQFLRWLERPGCSCWWVCLKWRREVVSLTLVKLQNHEIRMLGGPSTRALSLPGSWRLGVDEKGRREAPKLSSGDISSHSTQWSGKGRVSNIPSVSKERGLLEIRGGMVERANGGQKYVVLFFCVWSKMSKDEQLTLRGVQRKSPRQRKTKF